MMMFAVQRAHSTVNHALLRVLESVTHAMKDTISPKDTSAAVRYHFNVSLSPGSVNFQQYITNLGTKMRANVIHCCRYYYGHILHEYVFNFICLRKMCTAK